MTSKKRLLAILAHPDDESLGFGGTFARYAAEGVETFLITATRGQRGRYGTAAQSPGLEIVGKAREKELFEAAQVLGIQKVHLLDYLDGNLDQADPGIIVPEIANLIREIKPQVVLTFGPDGLYGHPDHMAISQFTTAALTKAALPEFESAVGNPHLVSKLYWFAWPPLKWSLYQAAFKKLTMQVDGQIREAQSSPEWMVSTRIETASFWQTWWNAIQCHQTQIAIYDRLKTLSEAEHLQLWSSQEFHRAFSMVNGGRKLEVDLFDGLC
ncbi:MAG: PIG-L family deacetylase [Saprospiraceae bacterium]|nr:PIG-L family deacetylase [Saprospiraceae bacterium]